MNRQRKKRKMIYNLKTFLFFEKPFRNTYTSCPKAVNY